MAEKRMFSKSIVLSDEFLDMPPSTRCLYFTLSMFGDDDGFVNSPKGIMRQCGATIDDMKLLVAKSFIIPFDSGIIVIRHWRLNNYIRSDRYTETVAKNEKALLDILKDGSYCLKSEFHQMKMFETPKVNSVSKSTTTWKPKLLEKEPKNDIEKIEKQYLENYEHLYKKGVLNSPNPIINWSASRKLTKDCLSKYSFETVLKAVKNSVNNDFCINKGYCLTTILSSGVLASLVNNTEISQQRKLENKYDLADLIS